MQCQNYKYLGIKICGDGRHDLGIQDRIHMGRQAISTENCVPWVRVTRKTKLNIKSIVLYGSAALHLKERNELRNC
jgi:hypothetical protein